MKLTGGFQERLKAWNPGFSPGLFKAVLVAVAASAFAIPLAIVALPYLEILNDMAVQAKGKAQGLYGASAGAKLPVERRPVAGTIPMDYYPYHLEGKDEATAKLAETTLANPLRPTMAVLEEGRRLFNYYCWHCHGREGLGDGPILSAGFPAPPSLHTAAARLFKDGRIFHIITRGQNKMPPYADKFSPTERWAVVHYVRALQRAHSPKPEDLRK